MLGLVLIAEAAAMSQGPVPPPALAPIYRQSPFFTPKVGERIRLASHVPPAWDVQDLVDLGISAFFSRTDELGPPDPRKGPRSLAALAKQRQAIEEQGPLWSLSVFTTFPSFDESLIAGEGTVNLLDGDRVPAWSPWDTERIRWSANQYGMVNRTLPRLPAVTLGVFGEYGDASMFTGQARLDPGLLATWDSLFGIQPPKPGFWAGDPKALDSWRRRIVQNHTSEQKAYEHWGMAIPDPLTTPVPITPAFPYTARLEFMDWYRSGISNLVTSLGSVAKEIFQGAELLIPVGPPNDLPYLGLDMFRVAAATAQNCHALKATNVGFYGFAEDWAMSLARLRGAARSARVPVWTEATTIGDGFDFQERLFEALALGARGIVDWPQSFRGNRGLLYRLLPSLTAANPVCDIAVIYPSSSHVLRPSQPVPGLLYRSLVELRDYCDFDVLEESAVIAGGLNGYRLAVLLEGTVWEQRALTAIREWVASGGVLVAYDFGKMGDPTGNTATFQELFGFASQLERARPTDVWTGPVPNAYRIQLGAKNDEEFLLGRWGAASSAGRPAFDGAQLRLPVRKGTDATVLLSFDPAQPPIEKVDFSVGGGKQTFTLSGAVSSFQFVVDSASVGSGDTVRVSFGGMGANRSIMVSAVMVSDGSDAEPLILQGYFEAPVSQTDIRTKWSRQFGKGLAVFFPGQRDLWKQYISLIRHLAFRLSDVRDGFQNARGIDDRRDGVYMVDLGSRVAALNTTDSEVSVRLPAEAGTVEARLPGKSLNILQLTTYLEPLVLECESMAGAADLERVTTPKGTVAAAAPAGRTLSALVTTPAAGRYKVFARLVRDGRLFPALFEIGEIQASPPAVPIGDVYLVGEFDLPAGDVKVSVTTSDAALADFIVLTADVQVAGFRLEQTQLLRTSSASTAVRTTGW